MQKFYIHKDDSQQGPFSIDELKDIQISRETLVWFEGEENWKKANDVDELKSLFKSIPPPINIIQPPITPPIIPIIEETKEALAPQIDKKPTKKKTTLIIGGSAVLLLGIIGIFVYSNQQSNQAEEQQQIEIQQQIQNQGAILEEQNRKIQEQADIENARLIEEENQQRAANAAQREAELESLKYDYDQAITNLRAAKIKLDQIKKFQLLRDPAVKEQQVQDQLDIIRSWENEVDRLEAEINRY
jgi:hypothetical protein